MKEYKDVQNFMKQISDKHSIKYQILENAFIEKFDYSIVELMDKPMEIKPWSYYSELLVSSDRITAGVKYMNNHENPLVEAYDLYGVPPHIITAIIGIESTYGTIPFKRTAVQSLGTLAFEYPRRAAYFTRELENIFILSKKEDTDPLSYRGSYAGAIGIPQFMPSNIIRYGKDGDGDGHVDLVTNHADAIVSVAYYLEQHGWKKGKPTISFVKTSKFIEDKYFDSSPCASGKKTVTELKNMGIIFDGIYADDEKGVLSRIDDGNRYLFVVFFENACPIHKYNSSLKYTTAVLKLARVLEKLGN